MRADDRGFSLIELLIVVAIILIIAAIAIPNFMRSRMSANQAAAVQSLRVINTAEVTYAATFGRGFSSTLAALGPPAVGSLPTASAAGLLDSVLAGGVKSGYNFAYTPANQDPAGDYHGYEVLANPSSPGVSGNAYYFTDESHVIRGNNLGTASAADSVIAQ